MTDWKTRAVPADEAVTCVPSGMRVFVHGAAATPTPLLAHVHWVVTRMGR